MFKRRGVYILRGAVVGTYLRVCFIYSFENLDTEVDINRAWETIRENIKISAKESLGYYELKNYESRFHEGSQNY
jgi:hypothetical protein